jgi:hypothetical protein
VRIPGLFYKIFVDEPIAAVTAKNLEENENKISSKLVGGRFDICGIELPSVVF